jgi:hypothetical protein
MRPMRSFVPNAIESRLLTEYLHRHSITPGSSNNTISAVGPEVHASARFMLLMASSISCVLLNPTVAQSTPALWKANLIAFTRSS